MLSLKPDQQQFRSIYEESYVLLQRFLFRLTRSHEDTADLLQETFLRLYEQESYPISSKAWLFKTGYRLFIDHWRKKHRFQFVSIDNSLPIYHDTTPEILYIRLETVHWIETNLNKLTFNQRIIFMLKYNEGASYQQIGEYIGCPENTVKCLVRRARIHLSQMAEHDKARLSS